MQLVQVDVAGLESFQAGLTTLDDMEPTVADAVRVV